MSDWIDEALVSLGYSPQMIAALRSAPRRFINPYRNYDFWYKGQTHWHSNRSDDVDGDRLSPYFVEEAYKRKGYTFVCLTDHNQAVPDPGVPGIMHITSGEDGDPRRHHICAIGINFERVHWYHDHVDPNRDTDLGGAENREAGLGIWRR